ncbi:MAG: ACT domain-containing protein [Thermoplasmatota archaeon]
MVTVDTISGIYVRLENRPGTLEKATKVLSDRRVNIDSISLETNGNVGFVRLYCARPREALEGLRTIGLEAYESPAVLASLPNRPGELARVSADLAASGINVEAVTTTSDGRIILRTSNNDLAAQILRKS